MKFIIILISLINIVWCQQANDFLNTNSIEVNPPPLKNLTELKKCGEGDEEDKFVCVPQHYCDPVTNTITRKASVDGIGVIKFKFGGGTCDHYMEVCCEISSNNKDTNVTTPTTEKPVVDPVSTQSFCGIRNYQGVGFRILGTQDNTAYFGEFPWMVAVLKKNYDPSSLEPLAICGASLITPIVVLTAAHSIIDKKMDNIKIRAGEWDTQTTNERFPYQERNVSEIIIHQNFNKYNGHNDIALLILDRSLAKAKNIGTICLPRSNQKFDSTNCFATGWGKDVFGKKGRYSTILKKVQLPFVGHEDCQRKLRKTELDEAFMLHKSFICAGGQAGVDTCAGDGGGPLVCLDPEDSTRYIQSGIVSWGIGCGEDQVPGVYADVSFFRNWIDEQLRLRNISTEPYIK